MRPQPYRVTFKPVVPNLLNVRFQDHPAGSSGSGSIEGQKIWPGRLQDEPQAMSIDDLACLLV